MRASIHWAAGATLLPVAAGALAQAQPTIQQQFETATAALDAGKSPEALAAYEAIERRLGKGSARSLAIVRVRKGRVLADLGRFDEAAAALRLGLAGLPASDASLREDRYLALVDLGEIAQSELDYGEALASFRAAAPLMPGIVERARAVRGMIMTGMFYDGPAALADADGAIAALAEAKVQDKPLEAMFRTLRGRVLTNLGRPEEAKKELLRAVGLLGGLTTRVNAADLAARADLAIAALRSGDMETAREYLAWTGAGQFANAFPSGAEMDPPPCGDDLAPGDVAVVEFSIRSDGSVGAATPIYASRPGPSALAFARAVRAWSWQPAEQARIGPLFRAMTRVEMRCTTAAERPSVRNLLGTQVDEWLAERGFPVEESAGRSDARRLRPLEAELARREAASGPDALALVPLLADLSRNAIVPEEQRRVYLARAEAIARREKAPAGVIAWFAMPQLVSGRGWGRGNQAHYADGLRRLLQAPLIAADPRAAAAVRLELAETLYYARKNEEAIAELKGIAAMPGLGQHDPLRAGALVRLASLQLVAGDAGAARAAFAASGLSADQCSLVDTPPRRRAGGASSNDFPNDALRWGFEGWVRLEWDLSAAGDTINVRPTVAYPPFVFSDSATRLIDRFRYQATYRPDGGLACGGRSTRVAFKRGY
jgi:tetratricopeptide (TPR) repeat protein